MLKNTNVVEFSDIKNHAEEIDLFPGKYHWNFINDYIWRPGDVDTSLTEEQVREWNCKHRDFSRNVFVVRTEDFDDRWLDDRRQWAEPLQKMIVSFMEKHEITEMVVVMDHNAYLPSRMGTDNLEPVPSDYDAEPLPSLKV